MLLLPVLAQARPVSESRAREIASGFFSGVPTRAAGDGVILVWAGTEFPGQGQDVEIGEEASMYIYNTVGTGGFVIVSGESGMPPVLAFSDRAGFDVHDMSPATRELLSGWCRQVNAVKQRPDMASEEDDVQDSGIGNVVRYYPTALWGQGEPYNLEAPEVDGVRCVSGCVATAMAIVAYHHRYPQHGTGTTPEYKYYGGRYTMPANELGRTYDYDSMLSDYSGTYTQEQGQAVAALIKDMGTAVKMNYGPSASGAYNSSMVPAMIQHFGYSRNALMVTADGYDHEEWVSMLQANLDACGPTLYRGENKEGGHAFVIDGYTDLGYFSINYGWKGKNDGYYLLPEIEYYVSQSAILDLVPDAGGATDYEDYLCVLASKDSSTSEMVYGFQSLSDKYETGVEFMCRIAAVTNLSPVDFNGKVKIVLCDRDGNVKADMTEEMPVEGLGYYKDHFFGEPVAVTVSQKIETGDRLRVYYRGEHSDGWKWARGYDASSRYEIVLSSTAEEVAEQTGLSYSKVTGLLEVTSTLAVQVTIQGDGFEASVSAAPFKTAAVDLSTCPPGEYTLKMLSGEDPYSLVLKL